MNFQKSWQLVVGDLQEKPLGWILKTNARFIAWRNLHCGDQATQAGWHVGRDCGRRCVCPTNSAQVPVAQYK